MDERSNRISTLSGDLGVLSTALDKTFPYRCRVCDGRGGEVTWVDCEPVVKACTSCYYNELDPLNINLRMTFKGYLPTYGWWSWISPTAGFDLLDAEGTDRVDLLTDEIDRVRGELSRLIDEVLSDNP